MVYVYHNLDWAGLFQRSCGDRFKKFGYVGFCELKRGHSGDHAAERGMEWVRWNDLGRIWITLPGSQHQEPSDDVWTNDA
jgi:hypothetical protein